MIPLKHAPGSILFSGFALLLFVTLPAASARAQAPVQPEATQFEAVDVTDVVNLSTGDFVYSLPLVEVPGPEGSYPIAMSYHSGIGPNQEATWVGLGWTLNAGAINRTVSGYPDEYKGASVYTTTDADGEEETTYSVGVYYMTAVGPVGMSMSYEVNSGMIGVNYSASVTMGIKGSEFGPKLGVSGGTSGFNVSAGAGWTSDGGSADARVSYGSSGLGADVRGRYGRARAGGSVGGAGGPSANVGAIINPASESSVGFTLSSHGAGARFSKKGFGTTGMSYTSFSSATVSQSGFTIPIPTFVPDFFVTLGFSQRQWHLHEQIEEDSYGYARQESYYASSADNAKYERHKQGDYLYPSQDHYMVSAQGLTGTFAPFVKKPYRLYDPEDSEGKGQLKKSVSDEGVSWRPGDVVYRFLGDQGGNLVGPDSASWGEDFSQITSGDGDWHGARSIVADTSEATGQVNGFTVTDADGKRYEFMQSVNTLYKYTWTKDMEAGEDGLTNTMTMGTAYPDQWLLTAIKGPDYVDRDGSGAPSDDDWGYWVKFNYEADDLPHLWRTPYEGKSQSPEEENIMSYSGGIREAFHLTSIETATHVARFETEDSKNRETTPERDFLLGEGPYDTDPDLDVGKVLSVATYADAHDGRYYFRGNYTDFINEVGLGQDIVGVKYTDNLSQSHIANFGRLGLTASYNARLGMTKVVVENPPQQVKAAWLKPGLIPDGKYAEGRKLTKVSLHKKTVPDDAVRSVTFDYDYSLRPETPSSSATDSDGASGGALTLKAVHFEGQSGAVVTPPYRFDYAGGDAPGEGLNPAWHEHDWDRWGSYRDPGPDGEDRGRTKHLTPQREQRADKAAAWSLTKITTPTGGTVEIEYGSDDYYHVASGAVDYSMGRRFAIDGIGDHRFSFDDEGDVEESGIEVGQTIGISEFLRESAIGGSYELYIYKATVESISQGSIEISPDFTFEPPTDPDDTYERYIYVTPEAVYGGGSRVAAVTSTAGAKTYRTEYSYRNDAGHSTGVATSLPSLYGARQLPASFFNWYVGIRGGRGEYFTAFMKNEYGYGRPAPSVLYSQVTVTNVNEKRHPINGKTVYEYYTAEDEDYQYEVSSDIGEQTIIDRTGIYGRPKSVSYYEQLEGGPDPTFRKVKEEKSSYALSSELQERGRLEKKGETSFQLSEVESLGVTQEKYVFENESSNGLLQDRVRVDRQYQNVFQVGSKAVEYTYDDDASATPTGSITTHTKTFRWDVLTGRALATASEGSDGAASVTKSTPAYWTYPEMEARRMLTQPFQETSYRVPGLDVSSDGDLRSYAFPADDVIASTVTTWTDQFDVDGDGNGDSLAWRKNDTYRYAADYDYEPFSSALGYDGHTYPEVTASSPWKMTSNTTRYDRFSRAVEEVYEDGSYSAVIYGYDQEALVTATASRARRSEVRYEGFDGSESNVSRTGAGAASAGAPLGSVPSQVPTEGGGYTVELWARASDDGSVTLSSDGQSASASGDGWQLLSLRGIAPGSSISTSGSGHVDELRVHPDHTRMSTYAYDPLTWKVTAITGANNVSTFFEYDDAGRLVAVRDQDRYLTQRHRYAAAAFDRDTERLEEGEEVCFDASVSSGQFASYRWQVNGEQQGTSEAVCHTFSDEGVKRVTLELLDEAGRVVARRPQELEVTQPGDDEDLSVNVSCSEGPPRAFSCEAQARGGDGAYTYSWSGAASGSNNPVLVRGCNQDVHVTVTSGGQEAEAGTSTYCGQDPPR